MGKTSGSGSAGAILSRFVKQHAGSLRINMKKGLPPPFVVSRGYTPEYPWLGQQHPAPDGDKPRRRPRLLMQQASACLGCWRTAVAVACIVAGLVLIAYAGHAIVRGGGQGQGRAQARGRGHHASPKNAALAQGHRAETATPRAVPDAFTRLADGEAEVDGSPGPVPVEVTLEVGLPVTGGAAAAAEQPADDAPSAESVPLVIRLVDPVGAGEEAVSPVVFFEAAPLMNNEEGASAPVNVPVVDLTGDDDDKVQGRVPVGDLENEQGGAVQAAKRMLLLMRLGNLIGAERELTERVQISEALQQAYDDLQAAEDTAGGQDSALEHGQSDEPTLFDLLLAADQNASQQDDLDGHQQGEHHQEQERQQEQQGDLQEKQGDLQEQRQDAEQLSAILQWLWKNGQAWNAAQDQQDQQLQQEQLTDHQDHQDANDEQTRAILEWLWTNGQAWNAAQDQQEQQDQQLQQEQTDNQYQENAKGEQIRDILEWLWANGQVLDEKQVADEDGAPNDRFQRVQADQDSDDGDDEPSVVKIEESIQAARQLDALTLDEDGQPDAVPLTEVVSWDQLNEDDKQDAVLPHLAARGLDVVGVEPIKPEVLDDVRLTGVVHKERLGDERLVVPEKPEVHDDVHLIPVIPWERVDEGAHLRPDEHAGMHVTQVVPWDKVDGRQRTGGSYVTPDDKDAAATSVASTMPSSAPGQETGTAPVVEDGDTAAAPQESAAHEVEGTTPDLQDGPQQDDHQEFYPQQDVYPEQDVYPQQDVQHHHHHHDGYPQQESHPRQNVYPQQNVYLQQDGHPQQDEWQQVQGYRRLVSQRVPLMYHVLQLRRDQTTALQQEQRATAYLRLLDLHLLQHQQEAAARRAQRQHRGDLVRLQQYAGQLQRHQQEYEQRLLSHTYPQPAYLQPAHHQRAYPQQAYPQRTYPQRTYPQRTYPQQMYTQQRVQPVY